MGGVSGAGPRLFLLAGEPSGDALGAALVAGLKDLAPNVTLDGVAGPLMQAEGVPSLFPMDELSVMGLAEVLPRYLDLRRRLHQAADHVIATAPDVLLTIDSPDFSLRLAKLLKAARPDIHTVHYVAPSVWAWRPKRAQKMAAMIDQVLALLPFEPPYMEAAGMRCDFVGHPIVAAPQATAAEAEAFRTAHDLTDCPLVLVLPGSRKSEIARLGPIFGAAVQRIARAQPEARFVLPAASAVARQVQAEAASWPVYPLILDPTLGSTPAEKCAAFRAADVALAASGTVSLELAAADTPMVIAYTFNRLTNYLMKRAALVDTATLVNLVSETRVVPEFLLERCEPAAIADAVLQVLSAPDAQSAAARVTMERLGLSGEPPGHRAARAVLEGLAAAQAARRDG